VDTITTEQLDILMSLNGNTRLPHFEDEIFKDKALTKIYLSGLAKTCNELYDKSCNNVYDSARVAYMYAACVIRGRWAEAESVIGESDVYWNWYIKDTK
jgi:hypothetical protein